MFSSSRLSGLICLFAGYSAFSFADVIAKYLGRSLDTPATLFFMYGPMLALALLCAPRMGGFSAVFNVKKLKLHLLRAMLFAIGCLLFVSALQKIDITRAYAVVFTVPFVSTMLAIFILKERATARRWFLIASGFAGVLIVLRPGFVALGLPVVLVLASVPPLALFLIVTRKIGADEPLIGFAFWPGLVIVIGALSIMLAQKTGFSLAPAQALACLGGGAALMAGQLLTARGYTLVPLAVGTPLHYSQLLWGVIFGHFLFHETPDLWTLAGAAIIIASGIALVREKA